MRPLLIGLVAVVSASAQFQGLSTTDDGSAFYFSSDARRKGTDDNLYPKIYRVDGTGYTLIDQREPGPSLGAVSQNFYRLTAPLVSGDGRVVAYNAYRPCYGGSSCLSAEVNQGNVLGVPGRPNQTFTGHISISRNGRYGLNYGFGGFIHPQPGIVDLSGGAVIPLPAGSWGASNHRYVTNDAAVIYPGQPMTLWRASGSVTLANTRAAYDPQTNDAGTRVFYLDSASALYCYDVASAAETLLAGHADSFSFSGDGSVVLYIDGGQAYTVASDGAGRLQFTHEPDGLVEAALSGDGRVAFAATDTGRVLRLDLSWGGITELIPRTPEIRGVDEGGASSRGGGAPGTLMWITGTGLADSGGAVQVKVGGVPMPVIAVSPTEVRWQIAWGMGQGDMPFEFLSGDSPFESGPKILTLSAVNPSFYSVTKESGIELLAIHTNFEALVTQDNPARGGEIVHFYMGGLGPVSPPVADGTASPSSPPAATTTPLHCQFWDGGPNDTQVLWSGLAPTMIGIYQVSVRVPEGLRTNPASLVCDTGDSATQVTSLIWVQ